ncbi:MAG: hypothetical protein ACW964_04175 [Candidatus Hodarchaeales archaeon]|jgi:hypothetical protein
MSRTGLFSKKAINFMPPSAQKVYHIAHSQFFFPILMRENKQFWILRNIIIGLFSKIWKTQFSMAGLTTIEKKIVDLL